MILVTGATGNAGFPIVKELSKAGAKTRALARDPAKAGKLNLPNIEIVAGDFSDPSSLEAAMKGVERVMLISPPSQQLVEMEASAVAAAKKAGVRHVVKFSAAGADLDSPCRFAVAHGQAEKNLQESGLAWTILRPTFFMQNILGMAGMIKTGTIYFDASDGKAPFVDLGDVAAVAAKTLTQGGHEKKIYEITGPTSLSYGLIADIFSKLLGKPVNYARIPHEAAKEAMMKAGVPEWQAAGICELSEAVAQGRFGKTTDVVRRITGRPAMTFEQFAKDNLAAFQ